MTAYNARIRHFQWYQSLTKLQRIVAFYAKKLFFFLCPFLNKCLSNHRRIGWLKTFSKNAHNSKVKRTTAYWGTRKRWKRTKVNGPVLNGAPTLKVNARKLHNFIENDRANWLNSITPFSGSSARLRLKFITLFLNTSSYYKNKGFLSRYIHIYLCVLFFLIKYLTMSLLHTSFPGYRFNLNAWCLKRVILVLSNYLQKNCVHIIF